MLKIVLIALVCAVLIIYLKSVNSEFALLVTICAGIVILVSSLEYLKQFFDFVNNLVGLSGVDSQVFVVLMKIIGISYVVEFGADALVDFGLKSLADKLVFVGKIVITITSLPIIYSVFNLLFGLLQ